MSTQDTDATTESLTYWRVTDTGFAGLTFTNVTNIVQTEGGVEFETVDGGGTLPLNNDAFIHTHPNYVDSGEEGQTDRDVVVGDTDEDDMQKPWEGGPGRNREVEE